MDGVLTHQRRLDAARATIDYLMGRDEDEMTRDRPGVDVGAGARQRRNRGSGLGQPQGDRPADAASCTGDQRSLSLQFLHV